MAHLDGGEAVAVIFGRAEEEVGRQEDRDGLRRLVHAARHRALPRPGTLR